MHVRVANKCDLLAAAMVEHEEHTVFGQAVSA